MLKSLKKVDLLICFCYNISCGFENSNPQKFHGDVSKWGRLRALPVADEAKATEWPRSKFLHGSVKKFRVPGQDITGLTRNIVGCVTRPSLKLRYLSAFTLCAFALSEICISQFSRNSVIRLCLYNFIWRRIEVVITGLTRNQLGSNPPRVRISPSPPKSAFFF